MRWLEALRAGIARERAALSRIQIKNRQAGLRRIRTAPIIMMGQNALIRACMIGIVR